jgi:hypothetical protein
MIVTSGMLCFMVLGMSDASFQIWAERRRPHTILFYIQVSNERN